ncbi:type II toxin-antitoxin system RelE/ParE family toxin [Neorhizobium sp. T7_12]|uniref:type II toxin-antitoxin system RelE/ParE family toxin n=1 Tax=Neorhizobium sp. T7_12 TaxID=2093832 RepID=UPI000CF94054
MARKLQGYTLSPRARSDLEKIWRYSFQTWSRSQADEYYRELVDAMSDLAGELKRGKPIDHIRSGYFSLSCGSHLIIFKFGRTRISIIRVLHQRMNIGGHL